MASLRDKISNTLATGGKKLVRTASGQLVEEAVPLSDLAGQQGMVAAPTTPGGAAAIGATPDSAKMAGTPNQMQSAMRQNTDAVNTIQEAKADRQGRTQLTADEQARKEKAGKLQAGLGDTQAKAQQYIDNQVNALSSGPTGYDTWKTDSTNAATKADADFATATTEYNNKVAARDQKKARVEGATSSALSSIKQMQDAIQSGKLPKSQISSLKSQINSIKSNLGKSLAAEGLTPSEITELMGGGKYFPPDIGPAPTRGAVAPVALPVTGLTNPFTAPTEADKPVLDAAWADMSSPDMNKRVAAVQTIQRITKLDPTAFNAAVDSAVASQSVSGIGKQAAAQIGAGSLMDILPQLGIGGDDPAASLAEMLGVTKQDVEKMSVDDLSAAVNQVGSTTGATDAAANSALLGAAERAEMQERSRDLSTSGAAAVDAQLTRLGTDLESADEVEFFGKKGTISELLSDEGISKQITALVNNPDELAKLPADSPLRKFIDQYRDVLKAVASDTKAAVKESEDIKATHAAATTLGSVSLSPDVLAAFQIDTSDTTKRVDVNKIPLLSWAKTLPEEQQGEIGLLLNKSPELAKELMALTPNQIRELDIPRGKKWKQFEAAQGMQQKWKEIDPTNVDEILNFIAPGGPNSTQMNTLLGQAFMLQQAGLPGPAIPPGLDVSPRDGKLDSPDKLAKYVTQNLGGGSLRAALSGKAAPTLPSLSPEFTSFTTSPSQQKILEWSGNTGKFTEDTIRGLVGNNISTAEILEMASSAGLKTTTALRTAVTAFRTGKAKELIKGAMTYPSTSQKIDGLRQAIEYARNDPKAEADLPTLEAALNQLLGQQKPAAPQVGALAISPDTSSSGSGTRATSTVATTPNAGTGVSLEWVK
jgi:molecular chaperone GrpE (heat shock protein)